MIADRTDATFDTLTDLFLGAGSATPEPSRATKSGGGGGMTTYEAVVLGNLPGVASAWPGQYARTLSERLGAPVALLHRDASELILHLIGADDAQVPDDLTAEQAISSALAHVGSTGRVLLAITSPDDEAALLSDPRITAVTVLSGADDPSCVNAYRLIRRVASVAGAARGDAQPPLAVRLMLAGADHARCQHAFDRLSESCGSFLEVALESAGSIERLDGSATPSRVLFDGACDQQLSELLTAAASVAPVTFTAAPSRLRLARFEDDRRAQHTAAQATTQTAPQAAARVDAEVEAKPRSATPTKPARPVQPEQPHVAEASAGTRQTALGPVLAGLSALPFHYPGDPELLLAVDAAGVPQVVARAIGTEPRQMVYRLVAAAAWMWANRTLLSQVSSGMRDDTRAQLHLITDDIAAIRALLESEIKVHAAVDVTRARQGVVMVALN